MIAVAFLALWALGCAVVGVAVPFFPGEPPEMNPRVRIDGEPPDPGQTAMEPFRGPFRNGDPASEVVSELFPDLLGKEEKLPYSN